jgi:hypothetical protein
VATKAAPGELQITKWHLQMTSDDAHMKGKYNATAIGALAHRIAVRVHNSMTSRASHLLFFLIALVGRQSLKLFLLLGILLPLARRHCDACWNVWCCGCEMALKEDGEGCGESEQLGCGGERTQLGQGKWRPVRPARGAKFRLGRQGRRYRGEWHHVQSVVL